MNGDDFAQQPWLGQRREQRLEDLLADQIMGENGDRAMTLLSKYAFEEMSFNRFEHQLRRDAEKDHMDKIAKIREDRERRNKEEKEAKEGKNGEKK